MEIKCLEIRDRNTFLPIRLFSLMTAEAPPDGR
jgi:hypothetical protein